MNIIEMAEQAGVAFGSDDYPEIWQTYMDVGKKEIETFALLVAAQTRARCIELVLAGSSMPIQTRTLEALQRDRKRIAALIEEDGK